MGINSASEELFNEARDKIIHLIASNSKSMDLFHLLDLELDEHGHFLFEDSIIDIPDAIEFSIISTHQNKALKV